MRVLADVESDFLARVHPDFEVALRVDVFDSAEITISNVQFVSWRGELNPLLAWRRSGACRPLPRALRTGQRTCKHEPQSARRPVWLFVRRFRSGRTDLDLQNSSFADRKTDSQSVGVSLNGTHLGLAKLHVTHSKDETGTASGP
jgi:hypothetical protein